MKKKNKLALSMVGVVSTAAAAGIGLGSAIETTNQFPTSITDSNDVNKPNQGSNQDSQINENVELTENEGVVQGEFLTFTASLSGGSSKMKTAKSSSSDHEYSKYGGLPVGTYNKTVSFKYKTITPTYTSGWIETTLTNGDKASRYSSSEYHNNRVTMPILDSASHFYHSERTDGEVKNNAYPGWDVTQNSTDTQDVKFVTYNASETLKTAFPLLKDFAIEAVVLDLSKLSIQEANKILGEKSNTLEFVIIEGIDVEDKLGELVFPENVKKITLKGSANDINGMKFPSQLQELELYLGSSLNSVDPTIFPMTTNIISDVAMNGSSSIFKEIRIENDKINNSSPEMQEAINITYQYRIKERAFQGHSAGGYIGSWNLRKTSVTSFNNFIIPTLEDGTGRFYIAHVEIETKGESDPIKNEQITSDSPSNDSMIDGWFDWNADGWSKVTEVNVTSSVEVSLDTAAREIMGFIAKYPNIKTIDVKGIRLSNGSTHHELVANVKEMIVEKYGKESPKLNIEFPLPWDGKL